MEAIEIEKLNQIISRTDKSGNEKVELLITFTENYQAKQLQQTDVMRQRELLIGFLDWFAQTNTNGYCDEHIVDWYLQNKDN